MSQVKPFSADDLVRLRNKLPMDLAVFRKWGRIVVSNLRQLASAAQKDDLEAATSAIGILQSQIRIKRLPDGSFPMEGPFLKVFIGAEKYLNRERARIGAFEVCGIKGRSAHWVATLLVGHTITRLREAGCRRSQEYLFEIEAESVEQVWSAAKEVILGVLAENLGDLEDELSREIDLLWKSRIDAVSDYLRASDQIETTPISKGEMRGKQKEKKGTEIKEDEPQGKGYLGLELDEGRHIVRRAGRDAEVDLSSSNLHWGMLLALEKSRDSWLLLQSLRFVWKNYGVDDNPVEGTVNDAVSELRQKLRPLGINIKSSRNLGRMLVEIVVKTKPGKKPKRSKGRKRRAK